MAFTIHLGLELPILWVRTHGRGGGVGVGVGAGVGVSVGVGVGPETSLGGHGRGLPAFFRTLLGCFFWVLMFLPGGLNPFGPTVPSI